MCDGGLVLGGRGPVSGGGLGGGTGGVPARMCDGGLVLGGRGPVSGEGLGGGTGGVPARMCDGGLVLGGRGPVSGEGLGGGTGGVPARITGTPRVGKLEDDVNSCRSSCWVMFSPKTPRARSAMISPTVRLIASATALLGTLTWVLVRCSKLASSSLWHAENAFVGQQSAGETIDHLSCCHRTPPGEKTH